MVALVLENGIGLNKKNKAGDTAAHILIRKGKPRLWRHHGSWETLAGLTSYVRALFLSFFFFFSF